MRSIILKTIYRTLLLSGTAQIIEHVVNLLLGENIVEFHKMMKIIVKREEFKINKINKVIEIMIIHGFIEELLFRLPILLIQMYLPKLTNISFLLISVLFAYAHKENIPIINNIITTNSLNLNPYHQIIVMFASIGITGSLLGYMALIDGNIYNVAIVHGLYDIIAGLSKHGG